MPYGEIRVDTITFTNGGVDKSITVSGLFASTSGNLTVTGTVSGVTATFATGTFSSQVSGLTVIGTTGTFTSLTGTTVTGANASFVSGIFTNQISGATVTGTTANFTSGNFTSISGGTCTVTSGVFASGTATNPSISFVSDPNTGIYSPGADQVALSTNSNERLRIDSSGRVGIGTSTPVYLLDVNGRIRGVGSSTALIASNGSGTGQTSISLIREGATTDQKTWELLTDSSGDYKIRTINDDYTASQDAIVVNRGSGFSIDRLTLHTNGSERLRIDSSGRLGLGTSSPFTTLHSTKSITGGSPATSGTTDANVFARFQGGSVGLDIGGTVAGTQWIQPRDVNNFATNYGLSLCPNGGNVGVGTTSPSAKLDVNGNIFSDSSSGDTVFSSSANWNYANFYARRNASNVSTAKMFGMMLNGDNVDDTTLTNYPSIWGTYSGTPTTSSTSVGLSAVMNLGAPSGIALHTNGSERARIDNSGRLLVGTSTARTIEPYGLGTDGQVANTYESVSDTNPGPGLALCSNSTTARMGPYLYLCRSGAASVGSNTLVSSGDNLGTISFAGADGTDVRTRGAAIYCEVDGTPGANDMPGRLVFSTTADGASSPTERMRIKSTGIINIGNTPTYADNTAALAGGLVAGDIYRKSDGTLMIAY